MSRIDDDIQQILDKQVSDFSELTNKQIQETQSVDHQLVFSFTDTTYAIFRIQVRYESPDEILILSDFPDILILKKAGILSDEQYTRASTALYGKRKTRADYERENLRRLAQQYPEVIDELKTNSRQ